MKDVPPDGSFEARVLGQRGPESAEPAAERSHHLADMFSDQKVADSDLANGAFHVLDEYLSDPDGGFGRLLLLPLEPKKDQSQDSRNHVETAIESVRNGAFAVPGRIARQRNHSIIKRAIGVDA